MRNTTKLAGTKDMAKMTQMDTSTSTEVVILEVESKVRMEMASVEHKSQGLGYLQGHLRKLLFGQIERVVERIDAELGALGPGGEIGAQDAIVHDIEERSDTVPALVIEPDLHDKKKKKRKS